MPGRGHEIEVRHGPACRRCRRLSAPETTSVLIATDEVEDLLAFGETTSMNHPQASSMRMTDRPGLRDIPERLRVSEVAINALDDSTADSMDAPTGVRVQ